MNFTYDYLTDNNALGKHFGSCLATSSCNAGIGAGRRELCQQRCILCKMTLGQIPQLVIKTPNYLPAKCDNGLVFSALICVFLLGFCFLLSKHGETWEKGQQQRDFGIVLMASHLVC